MTTQPTVEMEARALVDFVRKLKGDRDHDIPEDRGTLALLRGALTDSTERRMRTWRILARFGGIPVNEEYKPKVVRTVAGLMSMPHLHHADCGKSFGGNCVELLGDEELKSLHKAEQTGPVARRVQHLLSSTREEVCSRVSQLGRRLDSVSRKGNNTHALNFIRLYSDLIYWSEDVKVKARWAADFWGAAEEDESANPEAKL